MQKRYIETNIVEIVGVSETKKQSFGHFTENAVNECLRWLKKTYGDEFSFVVNPPLELNSLTDKNEKRFMWVPDDGDGFESVVDWTPENGDEHIVDGKFTSVWEAGEITSECKVNTETKEIVSFGDILNVIGIDASEHLRDELYIGQEVYDVERLECELEDPSGNKYWYR